MNTKVKKILILVTSVILAVGGVLVYAKTIVEPPMELKQKDPYMMDLSECCNSFSHVQNEKQEDSLFATATDRVYLYLKEDKIKKEEADKKTETIVALYSPMFIKRSFEKFRQSSWKEEDHKYMLSVVAQLESTKKSDGSKACAKGTQDSLKLISRIINDYKLAKAISRRTSFLGISNAQSTITKARQYAKDTWLSNCTDLVSSLNSVRPRIAQSHYNYISSMVEKLRNYRYYSQSYYDNTLVPQVDAAVTEYEKNAKSLYGSMNNVNSLWAKARAYYNEASNYYQ